MFFSCHRKKSKSIWKKKLCKISTKILQEFSLAFLSVSDAIVSVSHLILSQCIFSLTEHFLMGVLCKIINIQHPDFLKDRFKIQCLPLWASFIHENKMCNRKCNHSNYTEISALIHALSIFAIFLLRNLSLQIKHIAL